MEIDKKPEVLIIDDELNFRRYLQIFLETNGYEVLQAESGEEGVEMISCKRPDITLLDLSLPGISGLEVIEKLNKIECTTPIVMLTASGNVQDAVSALKLGAYDYLQKPVDEERLLSILTNGLSHASLVEEVKELKEVIRGKYSFETIVAQSENMKQVFYLMEKAVESNVNVLIKGPSGTGKELIAQAIHFNSARKDKPFITVNCAAIPDTLIESELFGHEKGSFTGAINRKIGKFEAANGGTIFLDEIGDMNFETQAKTLRAIQERIIERVGGNTPIPVDIRIVAATNINFEEAIENSLFREDLYYRISTFPIELPPLKERSEDIPLLVQHILQNLEDPRTITVSKDVWPLLEHYDWPGNIRELQNVVQRAALLCDGEIRVVDLPQELRNREGKTKRQGVKFEQILQEASMDDVIPLEKVEEKMINHAIKITEGNYAEAARLLGISRATLYRKAELYQLVRK